MREKCLISPIIEEFRINIGRFFHLIFIKLKKKTKTAVKYWLESIAFFFLFFFKLWLESIASIGENEKLEVIEWFFI